MRNTVRHQQPLEYRCHIDSKPDVHQLFSCTNKALMPNESCHPFTFYKYFSYFAYVEITFINVPLSAKFDFSLSPCYPTGLLFFLISWIWKKFLKKCSMRITFWFSAPNFVSLFYLYLVTTRVGSHFLFVLIIREKIFY